MPGNTLAEFRLDSVCVSRLGWCGSLHAGEDENDLNWLGSLLDDAVGR